MNCGIDWRLTHENDNGTNASSFYSQVNADIIFCSYYLTLLLILWNFTSTNNKRFKQYTTKQESVQLEKAKICDSQICSILLKKQLIIKMPLKNENKHAGAFFAKTGLKQRVFN